jgi:hypothetical protein
MPSIIHPKAGPDAGRGNEPRSGLAPALFEVTGKISVDTALGGL